MAYLLKSMLYGGCRKCGALDSEYRVTPVAVGRYHGRRSPGSVDHPCGMHEGRSSIIQNRRIDLGTMLENIGAAICAA